MIKKISSRFITILSLMVILGSTVLSPIAAQDQEEKVVYSEEDWYIAEVFNANPDETTLMAVEENGERSYVTTNHITNEVFIDGELIETEFLEVDDNIYGINKRNLSNNGDIILASTPTIDYLTRLPVSHTIPVRGIAALTAAIASFLPGVGWAVAQEMATRVAAYGPEYAVVAYNQYKSRQSYYSNYHGVYYNKAINRDIRTYKESANSSNLVHGPVHGSWFDPIRP